MSVFVLPKDLPRRARLVLALAFTVIDDSGEVNPEGFPPSALTTLRRLTGHRKRGVQYALKELERFGLASTRIEQKTLRVRVDLQALKVEGGCEACGSPARGTGRWCARCKQVEGRDDRAWQVKALELHDMGLSPRRIAVRLDRPMFAGSAEDGRDPNGGAVVPYLLAKGLLGPEWAERLREATRGNGKGE